MSEQSSSPFIDFLPSGAFKSLITNEPVEFIPFHSHPISGFSSAPEKGPGLGPSSSVFSSFITKSMMLGTLIGVTVWSLYPLELREEYEGKDVFASQIVRYRPFFLSNKKTIIATTNAP